MWVPQTRCDVQLEVMRVLDNVLTQTQVLNTLQQPKLITNSREGIGRWDGGGGMGEGGN